MSKTLTSMSGEWKAVTLGDCVTRIQGGGTPSRLKLSFWGGEIPWASVKDFEEDRLDLTGTQESITRAGLVNSTASLVPPGIPIVCTRMGVGRAALAPMAVAINQDLKALYPDARMDARFMVWMLHQLRPLLDARAIGSTVKGISTGDLRTLGFKCPVAAEQFAITAVLDSIDDAIRQTGAVIEKLKKIKAGLLHDLLTRGIDENGEVRVGASGGQLVPLSELAFVNPPVDCKRLQPHNLVSFVPMEDVSESGHWGRRQSREWRTVRAGFTIFKENDILFAKITPCMENGKGMHAVGVANGFGFASTEFHVLRAKGNNSPRFIFWWTMNPALRLVAATRMTGSAGQQRVPAGFFDFFKIPLFEPAEQERIAAQLDAVEDRLVAEISTQAKYSFLKQGLMQDLLTGRVRVPIAVAGTASEEAATGQAANGREANIYFKRSVLAAEIVDQMHRDATFGHVKFMKTLYLVEQLAEVELDGHYHRAAAGPLDNRMIRSVDGQMKRQKWFDRVVRGTGPDGKACGYAYVPMENAGGHRQWFEKYWSGARSRIQAVIDLLKPFDSQRCEIVATLYEAWRALAVDGRAATDDAIMDEVLLRWNESKQAISRERWSAALGWMKAKGLCPEG